MNTFKRLSIDILGVLLIIGAIVFGWLPGIGGIPLFLAGLELIATNHEWARRLLVRLKKHGVKFTNAFFRNHPLLMMAYDVIAITLLGIAGYLIGTKTNNIIQALAAVLVFFGIGLLLGNRHRLVRINAFVRRIAQKKT